MYFEDVYMICQVYCYGLLFTNTYRQRHEEKMFIVMDEICYFCYCLVEVELRVCKTDNKIDLLLFTGEGNQFHYHKTEYGFF